MWRPSESKNKGGKATAGAIIIAIMVGGLIMSVCVVSVVCMICKKPKSKKKGEGDNSSEEELDSDEERRRKILERIRSENKV